MTTKKPTAGGSESVAIKPLLLSSSQTAFMAPLMKRLLKRSSIVGKS